MSLDIAGATAFVTGANRGIGRALVEALLARGARKVYAAARRPQELGGLADDPRVVPVALDITRPAAIRAAVAAAPDVTLLINNAGVVAQWGAEFTDARWLTAAREEFEVNALGTFAVTQAFAPVLAANGGGVVANVSSVVALVNFPQATSYSLSKAAVHSLTQATRALLRPQGTYVAGVYPGPVDTDMARDLTIDKTAPAQAAAAILDGLEAGAEEIFPDPVAAELGSTYLRGPKDLERQFTAA
jgi:NAD(P)-dependent dehydrogenase (short-subunit alcohol dehydrogenase family)